MRHLLRLRIYLRRYWLQVPASLLLLLILTALSLIIPEIIRQVIDVGLKQMDINFLIKAAMILVGIGVLNSIFTYLQRYISE